MAKTASRLIEVSPLRWVDDPVLPEECSSESGFDEEGKRVVRFWDLRGKSSYGYEVTISLVLNKRVIEIKAECTGSAMARFVAETLYIALKTNPLL